MKKPVLSVVDKEALNKVAAMNDFHITVISPNQRHLDDIASALKWKGSYPMPSFTTSLPCEYMNSTGNPVCPTS